MITDAQNLAHSEEGVQALRPLLPMTRIWVDDSRIYRADPFDGTSHVNATTTDEVQAELLRRYDMTPELAAAIAVVVRAGGGVHFHNGDFRGEYRQLTIHSIDAAGLRYALPGLREA